MSSVAGREKVEIALLGEQRPEVVERLGGRFELHPIYKAADPIAALRALGPRIRGAASHGMMGLSTAHIEALPKLEICAINGVGLETTDLPLARKRGIVVTTTPVLFDDVADLAIGLAIAACRRVAEGDRIVRGGTWKRPVGRKFTGMRAGILGLGRIGMAVARRLEGFAAIIGYSDPAPRDVPYRRYDDNIELARNSDILFLTAAGAPKAAAPPIVDRAVIGALGPRGIFINVARGWLVDEPALIEALAGGNLGAAGLDVYYDEPRVPEALRKLDNVVLTPHVASATEETVKAMGDCVVENLESWFAGRGAVTPVT